MKKVAVVVGVGVSSSTSAQAATLLRDPKRGAD